MHNEFEKIKVITTDWKRALPGAVYFDFTEKRHRKEIVHAFNNGASRIYTEKNISNPDIPITKVNNLDSVFINLLTDSYKESYENMNLIAVGGSKGKATVAKLLEIIFSGDIDYSKYFYNRKSFYSNSSRKRLVDAQSLEGTYNYIYEMRNKGRLNVPVIIDTNNDFFGFKDYLNFDSGILTNIIKESCTCDLSIQRYRQMFSTIKEQKPIIANIDQPNLLEILKDNDRNVLITYGLSKKAAVTATSIDVDGDLKFNYCLQRSIRTCNDKVLEPFETPLSLKAVGSHNIYNALAAVTCALFYEVPIQSIKGSLKNFNGIFRRFEKLQCKNFTIIDQYCSSIVDYITAFDSLQTMDYNKLYIISSVRTDIEKEEHIKIIEIIKEWVSLLNVKEINITSCLDVMPGFEFEPRSDIRLYRNEFKNNGICHNYYTYLYDCIEDTLKSVSSGDLVLILGGEEMNMSQMIIENYKDKKN